MYTYLSRTRISIQNFPNREKGKEDFAGQFYRFYHEKINITSQDSFPKQKILTQFMML